MMSLFPYDSNLIQIAKEFLMAISPPIREVSELLADQIRGFRFNNQVRTLTKAKHKLEEIGLSPNSVSLKLLVPLIDYCSLEEDDDMIDRWANLLANAANPASKYEIEIGHIEVLRQLTPQAALILDRLYDYYKQKCAQGIHDGENGFTPTLNQVKVMAELDERDFRRAMGIIGRLNLTYSGPIPTIRRQSYDMGDTVISLSGFAYDFVSACRGVE